MASQSLPIVHFQFFGEGHIRVNREDVQLRNPFLDLAVLAYIAQADGAMMEATALRRQFWPQSKPRAVTDWLCRVRKCLGEAICRKGNTIHLAANAGNCDLILFLQIASKKGTVEDKMGAIHLYRNGLFAHIPVKLLKEHKILTNLMRNVEAAYQDCIISCFRNLYSIHPKRLEVLVQELCACTLAEEQRMKNAALLAWCYREHGNLSAADQLLETHQGIQTRTAAAFIEQILDPKRLSRHIQTLRPVASNLHEFRRYTGSDVLIGRDIEDWVEKIRPHRVVNLFGPGGIGKTSLALAVANRYSSEVSSVFFVALGSVTEPDLVWHAIYKALRLEAMEDTFAMDVVLHHLRDKVSLLVLDCCEHLQGQEEPSSLRRTGIEEIILDIRNAAPLLRLVTTSRHSFHVVDRNIIVEPLGFEAAVELIERCMVRDNLVRQPARSSLSKLHPLHVGFPLFIEITAGLLITHSPEQLTNDRAIRPGTASEGQKALHQSYRLLSSEEQQALRQLSFFISDFNCDDVAGICGQEAVNCLKILVKRSLLQIKLVENEVDEYGFRNYGRSESPLHFFEMLAPIRDFGLALLGKAGRKELRKRELQYYCARALEAAERKYSSAADSFTIWIEFSRFNQDIAIDYALAEPDAFLDGLRLVNAYMLMIDDFEIYSAKSMRQCGEPIWKKFIEQATADTPTQELARAHVCWGIVIVRRVKYDEINYLEVIAIAEEAVKLASQCSDATTLGLAYCLLGLAYNKGQRDRMKSQHYYQLGMEFLKEETNVRLLWLLMLLGALNLDLIPASSDRLDKAIIMERKAEQADSFSHM